MTASLNIADGYWVISSKNTLSNQSLILDLQHPIDKTKDIRLTLHKQGNYFISNTPVNKNNDWLLQLSDVKKQWRLVGRLHRQTNTADLRASVQLP